MTRFHIRSLLIIPLFFVLTTGFAPDTGTITGQVTDTDSGQPLPGVNVMLEGTSFGSSTDGQGAFTIKLVPVGTYTLEAAYVGYESKEIKDVRVRSGETTRVDLSLYPADQEDIVVTPAAPPIIEQVQNVLNKRDATVGIVPYHAAVRSAESDRPVRRPHDPLPPDFNTEDYDRIYENPFLSVAVNPLSTFSIDVDAASYSNVRRFISQGQLPPADAVRIEEMINYFTYDYPNPTGDDPFSITMERAPAPWNPKHELVHIGLQGERIDTSDLPPSNLVFLLDVSGSMQSPNKLPLLKAAFRLLVNELREDDRVAIAVYAGAAGLVLPSTPGSEKDKILDAIENLHAGGSTAGAAGIRLAYEAAKEQFVEDGNNRVILATDGDFNVGVSSDAELVRLIESKREDGIFLTILGFGTGNLKDSKMEQLADKGNGSYAYIDSIHEAKKVLVNEMGATLLTIAKDVKLQLEFNPAKVQAYRLIGYENRLLAAEDFDDDTKDAGELGAGHSVTALYEIIPTGIEPDVDIRGVDSLRYQQTTVTPEAQETDEWMAVKLRYKAPDGDTSKLLTEVIREEDLTETPSDDFTFSAAVAAFGMLLRDSDYSGEATYEQVISMAREAKGDDLHGYRSEFIRLVEAVQGVAVAEGSGR